MKHFALSVTILLLSSTAWADDAGSGSVDDLLDSIPDITTKEEPEAEKAAPEPVDVLSLPEYVRLARKTVLATWQPSDKIVRKQPNLVTEMLIKIDPDGTISDISMVQSSGNKKFDKSAYAAITTTARIEAPPASLSDNVGNGVVVTFEARSR